MYLGYSDRVQPMLEKLRRFIDEEIIPNESRYNQELEGNRWSSPPVMQTMQAAAREAGLFNLFLSRDAEPFSQVEYAHLAEQMGRSEIAAEVFNCASPDTGNMAVLAQYGTPDQQKNFLIPLIAGSIKSAFALTEPAVASSDAGNIASMARRDGNGWILEGEKSWVSGAGDPRCGFLVVMCVTDPKAPLDQRQSLLLVPLDTPGVEIRRMISVFGYDDAPQGHAQIRFDKVRLPADALIGRQGQGFEIAQDRLGAGRIHHCMRSIGAAERALELMGQRAQTRYAFGKPLSELGGNVDVIANSRIEIEMSRLMALKAAWRLETAGLQDALIDIAQMKVAVPNMILNVIDRAIQLHGGMGVSEDTPLAKMWAAHRALRLSDGPDEVHREMIARNEFGRKSQSYL
ncbi:MAG: acyl-CoA dehydrogenase family protein [Pseudomonadales bacterium]|nr:acyl-CoA dehydrogenase family protein [Pseudomonadales bacterium]